MTRTAQLKAVGIAAVLAAGVWGWHTWRPGDERAIRRQLDRLADTVNEILPEQAAGVGSVARAAQVGGFFTEDVVVDLGQGFAPMHGRETVIAMAARLPSGPGSFTLRFDDVTVTVDPATSLADVRLAATLTARNQSSGERTVDARELQLAMRKTDSVWRITHVTAVDALRRQ
jgi:SnoaL-like domain